MRAKYCGGRGGVGPRWSGGRRGSRRRGVVSARRRARRGSSPHATTPRRAARARWATSGRAPLTCPSTSSRSAPRWPAPRRWRPWRGAEAGRTPAAACSTGVFAHKSGKSSSSTGGAGLWWRRCGAARVREDFRIAPLCGMVAAAERSSAEQRSGGKPQFLKFKELEISPE